MELTYRFKLRLLSTKKHRLLLDTIYAFRDCVNDWLAIIRELEQNGEKPTVKRIHELGYEKLKQKYYPLLQSDTIQDAMNWALQTYKSWKKVGGEFPKFEALLVSFKGVQAKLENDGLIVSLNGQRLFLPLHIPKKFKKLFQHKHGRVYIKREGKNWYAYISFKVPEKEPIKPVGVIGVDLGIRNFLVASNEKGREVLRISGEEMLKRREEYQRRRKLLQQHLMKDKGIKEAKLGQKERRWVNQFNHEVARKLVLVARQQNRAIAVEKLKGLKRNNNGKSRKLNKLLHDWPYADLLQKIKYKAKLYGVPVIEVSPRGTSKTCSRCGYYHKKFREQAVFKCPKCGFTADRDYNASVNIARKGLEKIMSNSSQP
ncbi:MAG: transposase [Thermococcus sp.]